MRLLEIDTVFITGGKMGKSASWVTCHKRLSFRAGQANKIMSLQQKPNFSSSMSYVFACITGDFPVPTCLTRSNIWPITDKNVTQIEPFKI